MLYALEQHKEKTYHILIFSKIPSLIKNTSNSSINDSTIVR